jgi:heme oxygenase (biliverdin-IX-beta and delta-forming)
MQCGALSPPLMSNIDMDNQVAARGDVRTTLRQATHADHVRLNRHPLLCRLTQPDLTLAQYIRIVEAYAHFYRRIETRILQATPAPGFDYQARRKTAWLDSDLMYLGHLTTVPPLAEQHWDIEPITSIGALAGVLYAIEGSTLGGQVIGRHLARHLRLDADAGARFFNAYGDDTKTRWQDFCLWLETLNEQTGELAHAQTSACKLFQKLEALLDAYP